jgi:hypothetical protein
LFAKGGFVTIRPHTFGDITELYVWNVSNNWDAVNDEYSDGDATYVFAGARNGRFKDLYHMTDISLPSGAVIDSLTLAMRVRMTANYSYSSSRTARLILKTYRVIYSAPLFYCGNDWQLVTWKLTNNPYTNQPWTQSEINSLQVGVELEGYYEPLKPLISYALCTQIYGDVEWHS